MVPVAEYFRSVEAVWALWLASLLALAWLTRRALHGLPWCDWRRILHREEGAAYSLSYVLVFPVYVLIVCLVIETSLILVVKMGTVHAAYAAARSRIVWSTTRPGPADEKSRLAAVHVMTGFASSQRVHARGAGIPSTFTTAGVRFLQAYSRYSLQPAPAPYVIAKYQFAARATRVQTRSENGDIVATVRYDMPLHVPGIARFLGRPAPWAGANFHVYPVVSTVRLQEEAPRNPQKSLGIAYVSQ